MFVGYLRKGFEKNLEELINNNHLFELELLKQTYDIYPEFCFAAYEKDKIVGVLSAYQFDKNIYINVLETLPLNYDVLQRLIDLFIQNCKNKNIFFLIKDSLIQYINQTIFKKHSSFSLFMYKGEAVAFEFSNSTAKQVNEQDYSSLSMKIDSEVFNDKRDAYISKDAVFPNSLKLSTTAGFLHSYVINKRHIRISPWLMKIGAFTDAEKLLRGVLYYRGLKKIFAYAPNEVEEIVDLYASYKFKKEEDYTLFYLGEKPNLRLESMYAI